MSMEKRQRIQIERMYIFENRQIHHFRKDTSLISGSNPVPQFSVIFSEGAGEFRGGFRRKSDIKLPCRKWGAHRDLPCGSLKLALNGGMNLISRSFGMGQRPVFSFSGKGEMDKWNRSRVH